MSYKVAIFSLLGGSGKTTIAVNLACQMSRSQSVCLVDADQQAAAAHWSSYGKLPVSVKFCPLTSRSQNEAWAGSLSATSVDAMVIDPPSQFDPACAAALMIADLVVVPIHASFYGLYTAPYTMQRLKEIFIRRGLDRPPPVLLVASLLNRRTTEGSEIQTALLQMGGRVAPAICWRDAFNASSSSHDWVGAFAPGSRAHQEVMALSAVVEKDLRSAPGLPTPQAAMAPRRRRRPV